MEIKITTGFPLSLSRGHFFPRDDAGWESKDEIFHTCCCQFSSVTQLCPTLCDPMNRTTPGLPAHHQLLEFTQTHVHLVGDAITNSFPIFLQWICILFTNNYIYTHTPEKAMAPHSSTLAWRIPCTEEPGRLQSMGLLRVGHDWATSLWLFTFMHWRRKWQPTPVFLPGESQGRGSLVGCCLWGHTELDTTEVT